MIRALSGREWPKMSVESCAMTSGADLKRERQARRLSQAELAAILKVGARTVGRWESGEELPASALPAIERFLAGEPNTAPTIDAATDAELLIELLARAEGRHRRTPGPPQNGNVVAKDSGRVLIDPERGVTLHLPPDDMHQREVR